MPHYHPNPKTSSHVFYEIAPALTFSHCMQCEDKNNICIESIPGQVLDIANQLSISQDIIDIENMLNE